jgi:hypothetical protein
MSRRPSSFVLVTVRIFGLGLIVANGAMFVATAARSAEPLAPDSAVRSNRFQVCDVSFLIPPEKCRIPLARDGVSKPIISERLFEMLKDFEVRGHPGVSDLYHKMVITGFRLDPCGPYAPFDGSSCACINLPSHEECHTCIR